MADKTDFTVVKNIFNISYLLVVFIFKQLVK